LSRASHPLTGFDTRSVDRLDLWALVWFLFYEIRPGEVTDEGIPTEGGPRPENEKDPMIVVSFAELVGTLASLADVHPELVQEQLKEYLTFDPNGRTPALRLGMAAERLRKFLAALKEIPENP
jgi:hypothetical protein